MSSFQTAVNNQPAPAVAGDFASMNPRFTVDAGPGGLVAGPSGAVVGRFAWAVSPEDIDGAPATVNSFGSGPVTGFLAREQQGLITVYLDASSMAVPQGFGLTLFNGGDFWVKNDGAGLATPGMKAYANFADGKITFAASGSVTAGGTSTASAITAQTFSATGAINNSTLTVSALASGTIHPGSTISGTNVASGTKVVSQLLPLLSGESLHGIGRYAVSIGDQSAVSTTISGTYGLLTVGGTVAGNFGLGNILAATGSVVAGTSITELGTGAGGAGTYIVDNNTGVTSQAINVSAVNVETKWYAMSTAQAGEMIKISDHPLG